MTRRKPLGRVRAARDDDDTRRIKTPGGTSLTTAQAEIDALRTELGDFDLEEARAARETELEGIEGKAEPEQVETETDRDEWCRLRTIQRHARMEELREELPPPLPGENPTDRDDFVWELYAGELEEAELEHNAAIEQCAALALRIIELEEELADLRGSEVGSAETEGSDP